MTQEERIATSDNPSPASDAPRSVSTPLIALFVAAAFIASSWFFYQQGQRDGAAGNTETTQIAATDATAPPSDSVAQQAATNDSASMPMAADGSAQPAASADLSKPTTTEADTANADAVAQSDSTSTPAATDNTAQPAAAGDMPKSAANTGMVAQPAARAVHAKPAAKRSLASVAKPSHPVVAVPENRDVALLGHPKPAYPNQALREREQGTVLVLAQVDVQGRVSDARVIRHSGWSALDRAAMNEVRNWQFQPALQDGKPVIASVQVPVSYRLDEQ